MTELAGQSLGGYLLEEELACGSMGIVYRGKQLALGREVAVKIFSPSLAHDPSFAARFVREAQIIAQLNHPQIVHIYDAGQDHDVLYFVMEYVEGPTLRLLLQLDGRIPQHLAAEYVAQAADALDAAYQACQVIHRDLKPEHLILDRRGRIKVMDFGLARALGLPQITTAKTLVGSLSYASPEQIRGKPLDQRSDMYALGIVLYELVTGSRPFSGRTLQELAQAITAGRFPPPTALMPDLSPGLEQILLTALAPNRDERFAQAGLLAKALRALHLHAPSAGESAPPQQKDPSAGVEPTASSLLPTRPQAQRLYTPLITSRFTLPLRERHAPLPDTSAQYEECVVSQEAGEVFVEI